MGIAGRHYLQSNFTPEIIAKQYSMVMRQTVLNARRRTKRGKLKFPLTSFASTHPETTNEETNF
jgi:hypothetical protein